MPRRSFVLASTLFAAAFLAFACSSPSSPAGGGGGGGNSPDVCAPYATPAGFDLTTPKVSFKGDVLPIFEVSCGLSSSCHGTPNGPREFLGSKTVTSDPTTILAGIVGVASADLPAMSFVKAGDDQNSFLMHKIDGDECTLNAQCGGNCGVSMPQDSPLLPVASRDVVRRWIAQGALNN